MFKILGLFYLSANIGLDSVIKGYFISSPILIHAYFVPGDLCTVKTCYNLLTFVSLIAYFENISLIEPHLNDVVFLSENAFRNFLMPVDQLSIVKPIYPITYPNPNNLYNIPDKVFYASHLVNSSSLHYKAPLNVYPSVYVNSTVRLNWLLKGHDMYVINGLDVHLNSTVRIKGFSNGHTIDPAALEIYNDLSFNYKKAIAIILIVSFWWSMA